MTSNAFTNLAKPTFETYSKIGSSSDYLTNKKSRLAYCNSAQNTCGKMRVRTYGERTLYETGRLLETTNQQHNKTNLINNLYSAIDLSGVVTVSDSSVTTPPKSTLIDVSILPFYEQYLVDPKAELFGNTQCSENNIVQYSKSNTAESYTANKVYWN